MKQITKQVLVFLVVFLALAWLLSGMKTSFSTPASVDISTLVSEIEQGKVDAMEVDKDSITVFLSNGEKQLVYKESQDSVSELAKNYSISPEALKKVKLTIKQDSPLTVFLSNVLPFLIPILVIGVLIFFTLRQVQGANSRAMMFGQMKTKDASKLSNTKIKFKDVAGAKEAKEELQEVVEFLKNPKKFVALGAKIPKGVLLVGPPGTGKTLMAKAVAGEAHVPFFSISGSEFVEMFVGVGASRVRDLFARAKKSAPCIIFVDELDAVGRQRGSGLGGSHDEREQTLNQILVEMDGFEPNSNIIILAATNRPDVLDPALLRPGRFDRRVILDMPSLKDRKEILAVHSQGKPYATDVNIDVIAERTSGFSGADLANLLNEAAILAARKNRQKITQEDVLESIEKVMLGPERKSHRLSDAEKKITAYHETGHALVAHFLPNTDPVHKISIVSRGHAAGYTIKLPSAEKYLRTKSELLEELAVFLGGRTAEQMIFGEITTGASNDLQEATNVCKQIIMRYGMNESLGQRTFGSREELVFLGKEIHEQRDYSEKMAEKIDHAIDDLLQQASKKAQEILTKHKDKLEEITKVLIAKESIERGEFEKLVGPSKKVGK